MLIDKSTEAISLVILYSVLFFKTLLVYKYIICLARTIVYKKIKKEFMLRNCIRQKYFRA